MAVESLAGVALTVRQEEQLMAMLLASPTWQGGRAQVLPILLEVEVSAALTGRLPKSKLH